jgi:two-component system cell cycle sensor histidine kinase/response regulator CckA
VYGIVKQSGGFIFAESVIGHGATFRVFLPAVAEGPAEETAHATSAAPTPRSPAGEKLLIVDDEAPIRMLLSRAFTALGYVTSVAATTHDALQLIDREGLPALVISDLWMPGSSGVDFLHHLRQRAPTLPLVLFSGDGEALAAADAEQWQHVALLQKPLRLDALAEVVAGLLQTADGSS